MEVTDIGNKEEGKFWQRKPAPGKGVLVTVGRTAQQAKTVRFLHVAFDATGDSFLVGDQHGNIYVFDITRNRFRLVQKTGQACTALAFSLCRTTEFIVALADYTIKCFDKDTKQLVSWMRGHEGTVSSISVHSSGHYAVTTSSDTAQLWDLDTFLRKKKLTIRQSVGIQKVFFLPHSDTILSCFSDDSIFAWDSDTLICKYQLPVPDSGPRISYRAFAVTQDGQTLAAGGRSNLLHLWCLDSKQLVSVIQMPPPVRTVRQLEFLPDTFDGGAKQTLGVLSQDGVLCFLDIHTCKPLFHIGSPDNAITTVAVSPNGRYVVAILDNGTIRVYSVQSLTRQLKKPPPSRVAAVSGAEANEDLKSKVKSEVVRRVAKHSGLKTHGKVPTPHAVSTAEDKENDFPAGLNKKKLLAHLKAFGEYPSKYRMFLWRHLLRLPKNYVAYSALTDKGLHPAYFRLQEKYPIKSPRLQRGLQRVLSALAHWAPVCGETEYLPLVAFPFVKLFKNTPMLCFEVVATIIVNWCQHWFEYSPRPPLNILCMTENILAHHDMQLLQHLKDCGITSQLYVWPLLETLFSEVLTRDEWLQLFDNVFSNHPSFLLMVCAAYIIFCRKHLLHFTHKEDFECFFHNRNNVDMGAIIAEAYRLMRITPADVHPRTMLSDFTPLTTDLYPVFNHQPEFMEAHQSREREKIQLQEKEYLRERLEESARRTHFLLRQAQEKSYHAEQERLQKAEEQWKLRQQKEDKAKGQRRTLEPQTKEFQLDAARRRFLKYQQDLNASQRHRLDQDVRRTMELCGQEEAAAVGDLEVRQMELEVQRRRLEQHRMMEPANEVHQEVAPRRAGREEDRLHSFKADMQALEESLAEACQQQIDAEQERRRGRLEELQRQTTAQDAREWDDVTISRAPTQEQRPPRPPADSDGPEQATMRTVRPTRGLPHRPTLPVVYTGTSAAGPAVDPSTVTSEPAADMVCLSSRSPSDTSSSVLSLPRGRAHMDSSERELLREIRELRQKLAARAGSSQSVHTLSSVS